MQICNFLVCCVITAFFSLSKRLTRLKQQWRVCYRPFFISKALYPEYPLISICSITSVKRLIFLLRAMTRLNVGVVNMNETGKKTGLFTLNRRAKDKRGAELTWTDTVRCFWLLFVLLIVNIIVVKKQTYSEWWYRRYSIQFCTHVVDSSVHLRQKAGFFCSMF